jgi:KaiC/GvpD/RAD55 family RecA-like ATPase
MTRDESVPTGITSLDIVLRGGFPPGSFILLLGDVGAGHYDFAYTSAVMLSYLNRNVHYISLTRSADDVLNEIKASFSLNDEIYERIQFSDLSQIYFGKSCIPYSWLGKEPSFDGMDGRSLVKRIVEIMDEDAKDGVVIVDSLTSLVQQTDWNEIIALLRGIQRASKGWKGIVYGLLSQNILGKREEEAIADCVDSVLVFEWENIGTTKRQRIMYMKKGRGIMPHLEEDNISNFEASVTRNGFEISSVKEIIGRR